MAFRNTSTSSNISNSEDFDDIPIVPPKPIVQKEYKEEIPDISVVSIISDNGPQLQNFQRNFLRPKTGCNVLPGNINYTTYKEQLGINLYVPKPFSHTTEKSNGVLDGALSNFKLCAACDSCVKNQAINSNHQYNEPYVSKYRAPIPLVISNELPDKEIKCKSEDEEAITNKRCCKCLDSNAISSSNHKFDTCNHKQLPGALSSNEPELVQIVTNPDCCCNKDQHYKLRKSLSEYERHENKLLCPVCFKKNCKCNFLGRKYNVNSLKNCTCEQIAEKPPANNSDEISSIWEYLKRQEEKIDSIRKQVSNFLSQHASCCIDQPTQKKELSNVAEHDIPYILSILGEHSNKITELQDEIKLLKLNEDNFSLTNDDKIDKSIINQAQKISCVSIENCNEDIHCPSHNEVCNVQGQKITKVSTSTMTSFAIENDDKCVYHKQLTVLTDIMRERKPSLSREHETIKFKETNGKISNSQKKKSQKLNKSSPILKCAANVSSNSSSDPHNTNDKQMLKTSRKSERKPKHVSAENKVTDKRYLKDCGSDSDVEEQKHSPTLKTDARKSHSSKQRLKNGMSPKEVDILKKRDSGNKETNWETSSSSTDTEFISPKHRQEMFDKIELHSEDEPSYLSFATVEYLNKYGLNHSGKNDRTKSSRKTTQSKRHS